MPGPIQISVPFPTPILYPMASASTRARAFDPKVFLASSGVGRRLVKLKAKQIIFAQGTPADSIFYMQSGRVKLTVVSPSGKEATITLLSAGDFIGEESIAPVSCSYVAT